MSYQFDFKRILKLNDKSHNVCLKSKLAFKIIANRKSRLRLYNR